MQQDPHSEASLGFLFSDVARLLRRNFNRSAQDLGLTQTQWRALVQIYRNPGIKQSQLADILEVQPISVARLIDRMEAAGWVQRTRDESDRRAVNLFLSDKAEPMVKKMRKQGTVVLDRALAGISKKEHEQLLRNLLLIRNNLTKDEVV